MPKDTSSRTQKHRGARLVFVDSEPSALVAPLKNYFRGAHKVRVLLSGGAAGDRYFLACRVANELGAPLTELSVSKYIGETEKNLRQVFADAREQTAIVLFDEADALFTKRGTVPSRRTRAGRNSRYLLQAARRYKNPALFSTAAPRPVLKALENLVGLVVDFGLQSGEGEVLGPGQPVMGQNFRVFVAKRELGICYVSALASKDQVEHSGNPSAESHGLASVILRRAVTKSRELFSWREAVRRGKDDYRDVRIELLDKSAGHPVVSWQLCRARPIRWTGPTLDGLDTDIAMEEVEIVFEQLEWR